MLLKLRRFEKLAARVASSAVSRVLTAKSRDGNFLAFQGDTYHQPCAITRDTTCNPVFTPACLRVSLQSNTVPTLNIQRR
jgi:hypothetical protein